MKMPYVLVTQIKHRIGLAPIGIGLFAITMFIAYMWQLSVSTSAGYTVRTLEQEIADLDHTIAMQEMRIASLKSIEGVKNRIELLGLVKPEHVSYVFTSSGNVAIR